MAKSYILKDASGKAAGYVQQVKDHIRCGVTGEGWPEGELWLFFENGKSSRRALNGESREQEWADDAANLLGACIACGERRLADTGEAARLLFAAGRRGGRRDEKHRAAAASVCAKEPGGLEESAPGEARSAQDDLAHTLPQRRWPPQPCCAHARYVDGAWRLIELD